MTLQQLTYFTKLAEVGHMGRTAEMLYIAQPSLSIAMKNLEDELRIPLFTHTGKRMELSDAGKAFYTHAARILQDVEEARLHMQNLAEMKEQRIRIGAVEPVFGGYLPEQMRRFQQVQGNEQVKFELSCEHTGELIRRLKNGLYDLLICSHSEDPEVQLTPLFEEKLVLVQPMDGKIDTIENLGTTPVIGYDPGSAMDGELTRLSNRLQIDLNIIYRAPHERAILSLVEKGFGCAIMPLVADLDYSGVKMRLIPGLHASRTIYMAERKGQQLTGAASRFAEYLWRGNE